MSMLRFRHLLVLPLFAALPALADTAPTPLQPLIDATPAAGTLTLPPGTYAGPVTIERPITIDGGGKATINGGGKGTVVTLATSGATLAGLRIVNSGMLHDKLDAGVQVRGRTNVLKDNVIEDCLIGIDLSRSDHNVIRRNHIRPRNEDIGLRGDGIRLWYSMDNVVQNNVVENARDTVIWYSQNNTLTGNRLVGGRYGFHFMFSKYNLARDNVFEGNTVGIFLMYADDVEIRHNRIIQSQGPSGIGIGMKESSGMVIVDNDILSNATGIYTDLSPNDPDHPITVEGNRIAYNGMAMMFHSDWEGVLVRRNDFIGNFGSVAVQGGGSALRHEWAGNHWDGYEGFDRNHDGIGDSPFEVYAYADRLWMDVRDAQFFRASPMLELLDFMERLAPFNTPKLVLRDSAPSLHPVAGKSDAAKPAS
ncbi:nitrous oxide reductase family maturation protein NosD [Azospirillum sp. sgz301742]